MNCELWVIMMYHCRFISSNTCTTLVGNVGNGGSYAYIGAGNTKEISVHYSQLFYKSKTTLKKKNSGQIPGFGTGVNKAAIY